MTTLDVETYARLLARLALRGGKGGARLEEILAELGVEAEALRASEPALRAELARAWPRRKGIAAMKFASAIGEELLRHGPLGIEVASMPLPAAREPDRKELPSYLQAPLALAPLPATPPPPAPTPAGPAATPKPTQPNPRLQATMDADTAAIVAAIARGPLPFANAAGGRGSSLAPAPTPAPAPTTPAAAPLDMPPASLDTYAAVTGALARGEAREAVLVAHGLSPEDFDKLTRAWAARFERDPALLAHFKDLARQATARRGT